VLRNVERCDMEISAKFLQNFMWIAVVEWEGQKPPSAFYRYIRRMLPGLRKRRKGKEMSKQAIWAQEGVYIIKSRKIAGLIVALAQQMGAKNAMLFNAHRVTLRGEDYIAAQLLTKLWSKRGPRRNNPPGWERHDIAEALRLAKTAGASGEFSPFHTKGEGQGKITETEAQNG
jgi:hypothetical protein